MLAPQFVLSMSSLMERAFGGLSQRRVSAGVNADAACSVGEP